MPLPFINKRYFGGKSASCEEKAVRSVMKSPNSVLKSKILKFNLQIEACRVVF